MKKPAGNRSRKPFDAETFRKQWATMTKEQRAQHIKAHGLSYREAPLADQVEACERLREMFPPGASVAAQVLHVSRSGMYRVIQVLAVDRKRNVPHDVSALVCRAIGRRWDGKHYGIGVGGCGFSATFEVVYELGRALYQDGFFCIGEGCPSNDHTNRETPPEGKPWKHSNPGYAFRETRL